MNKIRTALIGAGSFGRHHARVLSAMPDVELVAIVDTDLAKAQHLALEYKTHAFSHIESVVGQVDAAVVATPTVTHEPVAARLLDARIDVLVEKPIAETSAAGELLARLAQDRGRILQAGHLERFNPAVMALERVLSVPLFFEVHRLSIFSPRSLDIDVVLDLMIHDLDIVLSFVQAQPEEIRAAGISVLSPRVDIANVRLSFASGCIANLTASRVSTERVRKLRLFQPGEYVSLDYHRQDALRFAIRKNEPNRSDSSEFVSQNPPNFLQKPDLPEIGFESLNVVRAEPLQLELESFMASVRDRSRPRVDGFEAANSLRVAEAILAKIKEHADLVAETIRRSGPPDEIRRATSPAE